MIKYPELRIGNIMFDFVSGAFLRVVGITESTTDYYVIDRDKYPLQNGWFAQPVKITKEILEMCGFCKTKQHDWLYELPKTQFQVAHRKGEDGEWIFRMIGFSICKVEYLHELQNLISGISKKELDTQNIL